MRKKSIRSRNLNFQEFLAKYFKSIKPLNNFEIDEIARKLKIKHWIGIFMRDELNRKPNEYETFIMNTDISKNSGTHWTGMFIVNEKIYFDSYGLPPPLELIKYTGKPIKYNTFQLQEYNEVICGHLCLYVLWRLSNGDNFQNILFSII